MSRDKIREAQFTYVFKCFIKELGGFYPMYDKSSWKQYARSAAKETLDGINVKLYRAPEKPPYDNYIRHNNWLLHLLTTYFKDVFHEKSAENGVMPSHKYYNFLMPERTYNEIMLCINRNELLEIRDLIFEVIAIAQEKYTGDISFWEQEENKKLITTAEKEANKAIEVLTKADPFNFLDPDRIPTKLLGINFVFTDGSIKIEHEWLAGEFIEHFREYYDNLPFKNWKLDLKRYPVRFNENKDQLQFRFRLAKSFYNLLIGTGLYKLNGAANTPNKLMICIAELMEFCLIPLAGEEESDSEKAKIVRNWIKRSKLENSTSYLSVEVNINRLESYFPKNFLELGEEIKRIDALNSATYIAVRFNIEHLKTDLAHLYQCLEQIRHYIGHQLTREGVKSLPNFPEMEAFSSLLLGAKKGQKINSITFKIEGSEQEQTLSSSLPLLMISDALKAYQYKNRVEADTEIYNTKFKKLENGVIEIEYDKSFTSPEDRFIVKFVGGFYNFLQDEAAPNDNEYDPSIRYHEIIANLLLLSGFFYRETVSDQYAVTMVKKWHSQYRVL